MHTQKNLFLCIGRRRSFRRRPSRSRGRPFERSARADVLFLLPPSEFLFPACRATELAAQNVSSVVADAVGGGSRGADNAPAPSWYSHVQGQHITGVSEFTMFPLVFFPPD